MPEEYPHGIWRDGGCDGTLSPVGWALETHRIACFRLPLGGTLLLGPRGRLLTMDRGDLDAMRRADRQGRFQWRQPGVMLYPLPADLLYVLVAPEALQPAYSEALAGLLPAPGRAVLKPPGDEP